MILLPAGCSARSCAHQTPAPPPPEGSRRWPHPAIGALGHPSPPAQSSPDCAPVLDRCRNTHRRWCIFRGSLLKIKRYRAGCSLRCARVPAVSTSCPSICVHPPEMSLTTRCEIPSVDVTGGWICRLRARQPCNRHCGSGREIDVGRQRHRNRHVAPANGVLCPML